MSLFLGFLCGVPILLGWYTGLLLVSRAVKPPRWFLVGAALLPLPFVGLVLYGEVSYALTQEAIVIGACEGDIAAIERAIALGADPNRPDDNDGFALPCAVGNGHVAAARTLLRHGADPNRWGSFGYAREVAKQSDDPEMRRLFGVREKGPRAR